MEAEVSLSGRACQLGTCGGGVALPSFSRQKRNALQDPLAKRRMILDRPTAKGCRFLCSNRHLRPPQRNPAGWFWTGRGIKRKSKSRNIATACGERKSLQQTCFDVLSQVCDSWQPNHSLVHASSSVK